MLIAIPWPMAWEQGGVQGLMRFVAYLTVEVAGWLNIPAVQHGNLVEVGAGVLGIDEACSGVRSLQSGLMVSLFLGELHRFSALRRISLLAVSLVLVLFANVCRTTFLVWVASTRGLPQMESWHNLAGTIVMIIVLTGLVLLAYLITPKSNAGTHKSPAVVVPWVTLPRWFGLALVTCLAATAAVTELWYRSHETTLIANPSWSMAWPANNPDFKKSELPEKSLAILRCSDSQAASWRDEDGNAWSGFLLRWPAGRNSAQLAKGHTPEICLTAAGATKIDDFGPVTFQAGGITLPFRHQTYESRGQVAHVFYCLWPERIAVGEKPVLENGSRASRLEAVLAGKRHLGQQVLEFTIAGPQSRDAAADLLKHELPKLISLAVNSHAAAK
jgi:exosortase/archaeosortase family protein